MNIIMEIPIVDIRPNPWQTRRETNNDHIQSLALDIAANGLLQIPVGRLVLADWSIADLDALVSVQLLGEIPEGSRVQLAFGHNRLEAYEWLHHRGPYSNIGGDWSNIPIQLKVLDGDQMAAVAWSENEKRQDLNPIERALAIARRIEDFGWTHAEAAEKLGVSRSVVSNTQRLLKLPERVQDYICNGEISERQAMAMLRFFEADPERFDPPHYYDNLANYLIDLARSGESSDSLREWVNSKVGFYNKIAPPEEKNESRLPEVLLPDKTVEPTDEQPEDEIPFTPLHETPPYAQERLTPVTQVALPQEEPTYQDIYPFPIVKKEEAPVDPMQRLVDGSQAIVDEIDAKKKSWEQSTILLQLRFFPESGHENGRSVCVSASCEGTSQHSIRFFYENELALPPKLSNRLAELRFAVEGKPNETYPPSQD